MLLYMLKRRLFFATVMMLFGAGAASGADQDSGFFNFSKEPPPRSEYEKALKNTGSVALGDYVYAACGEHGTKLVRRPVEAVSDEWTACAPAPEEMGDAPSIASLDGELYVTGVGEDGTRSFIFDPSDETWTPISAADQDMRGYVGASCGTDHVLFFNGNQPDDRIVAYHRISDEWFEIGRLPSVIQAVGAISDGTDFIVFSETTAIEGSAVLRPTKYHWLNHLVVGALLLSIVVIGVVMSRRERSGNDYFRAGNRIPWWAAGLSMFAALASAISLMSMPSQGYATNWIYFSISIFTVLIQLPILLIYYVPLVRRLKVSTANEYLERRFGLPARMLGFVFFTLNQVLIRVGSILLLPSLALHSIFGLPLQTCILIMGGVTILFVTLGGLEAVVWADVLQAVIMVSAIVICALWVLFSLDLVPADAMAILKEHDKLKLFDWRMDLASPVVVVLVANILATALGMIGDQNFIQRVQCTHSEKDSRKAMITQLAIAVPLNLVLFTLGTLLFLYYKTRPEALNPALDKQGVFPFFAAENLPVGLPGVVVAALLAATMSTVAGALNSVANLGVEDIYRRFSKNASDHKCITLGRILTVSFGLVGTGFALWRSFSPMGSVWDLTFRLMGVLLAPLTGMYVLGIFSKRAHNTGVWVGALAAVGSYFLAEKFLNLNSLAYLPFCMMVSVVVGYIASILIPGKTKDLTGLTAYTLLDKEADG
ncbi:MAG: sodium/solute symporter [Pontiellaceae bacterium]|nr:sodium/solute symporter [Pontiellaceae bacterium]